MREDVRRIMVATAEGESERDYFGTCLVAISIPSHPSRRFAFIFMRVIYYTRPKFRWELDRVLWKSAIHNPSGR